MSIEAVREPGKPTAVTWDEDRWRMWLVDGEPVTESRFGTEWTLGQCPLFDKALTAYKVLTEGLAPPEGFKREREGVGIIELKRFQEGRGWVTITQRLPTGDWKFLSCNLTPNEMQELATLFAEIAEQESHQNADA